MLILFNSLPPGEELELLNMLFDALLILGVVVTTVSSRSIGNLGVLLRRFCDYNFLFLYYSTVKSVLNSGLRMAGSIAFLFWLSKCQWAI